MAVRTLRIVGWLAIVAPGALSATAWAQPVDFQLEVRPILQEHCFQCHGPDMGTREAGLRLDMRDMALAPLESGAVAIVPAKPQDSELVRRVESADPDVVMPPPDAKNHLTPAQIESLKRWIAEGAPFASHWAFNAPTRPSVPAVEGATIHNPVDALVADRLGRDGLALSSPAAPEILCRRIYLDLIGMPPTPAEVDAFVAAAQSDQAAAVNDLIDRLLESPHYGEKWARHWLDVARYADSNGYEKDLPRQQWAWRDWVIGAFNRDMPYDQFLREQVAGDMLAREALEAMDVASPAAADLLAAAQDMTVATGFLRNGMINEEGAIVPEEFRMESMYDRMDCVGKAVLGLSLQCGQCHTHKFDPLTHTEYYGLFAFLNNTFEAQSWVYTPAQLTKIAEIQRGIAAIEGNIRTQRPEWAQELAAWESAQLAIENDAQWEILEARDLHSSSELNHPTSLADKSILTLGHKTVSGDVTMIVEPKLAGVTGIRIEILKHGDLPFDGPGRSFKGTWALTELVVESKKPGESTWERIKLVNATADYSEPDHKLEPEWDNKGDAEHKRTCGPVAYLVDGDDLTAWRADRGVGRRNAESVAAAQFEKPLDLPEGTQLKFSLRMNHGGDDNGEKNVMVGRFRLAVSRAGDPRVPAIPYTAMLAMKTPPGQRAPQQIAQLFDAWRQSVSELKPLNDQIDALWQEFPEAPTSVLHMKERGLADLRPTYRLERGSWTQPREQVVQHVPAALHPLDLKDPSQPAASETAANQPAASQTGGTQPAASQTGGACSAVNATTTAAPVPTRLDFARWLSDRRSPLTARVAVNRAWQVIFGSGLVETAEDFGTRAPAPEHQAVLDWLAVEFMEQGWSHKRLLKTILTSATYQQSSTVTPALLERDPRNRLLARGPRFRVEAETVRDVSLSIAGLLHPQVGGPSIFPPVPQNVLDYNFFKPTYWNVPNGPDRYRRALYVFRKRSMPDPVLTTFDAPNADFSCARRVRSNTPLAALVSLNEPVFVESARAMALRVLSEGGPTDADRVDYAFRLCTARRPKPAEAETVLALIAQQRRRIADGWLSVREITTGDPSRLPELPQGTTPQDAAAWTLASRVLLNMDATLTKE